MTLETMVCSFPPQLLAEVAADVRVGPGPVSAEAGSAVSPEFPDPAWLALWLDKSKAIIMSLASGFLKQWASGNPQRGQLALFSMGQTVAK